METRRSDTTLYTAAAAVGVPSTSDPRNHVPGRLTCSGVPDRSRLGAVANRLIITSVVELVDGYYHVYKYLVLSIVCIYQFLTCDE